MNNPFIVSEVYVWVTKAPGENGDEGVAIAHDPTTGFDSVIGSANLGVAASLKPFIDAIERKSGYSGKLVRFVIDAVVDPEVINEFVALHDGDDIPTQTH